MSESVEEQTPEERRALFRVVSGDPSPEELAALTVVLAAATSGGEDPAPTPHSLWGHPAAGVRRPLTVGPGAWRAQALPR
ncbi:acyl-CoA carboxylase subunit epsilon [Pseudonocardia sp. WMMC193]|uniref:acyl-CoA carboxylase subunit epsilon n=1 Tax=Pseudonocardia sp. WMMC193 TaxID=2911965 RepID=UPI001F3579E6|nr:acyl-CoA carboxylase subunit epsilon [Pseudonocardia sp. WMMC193]MCF7553271.1 acyl-CoA carboxylase subunit epsilon [Pseudonocardia sp. WMMC193]